MLCTCSTLAPLVLIGVDAHAQPPQAPITRAVGPDALAGSLTDARAFGTQTRDGELYRSFGIGADIWNIGDRPVEWVNNTNQHAVIVQAIYRAEGNRFEQLGMSWAKHVVVAANMPFDPSYGPCISPGFNKLGVNCGDVYSATQNASQTGLGPRYDLNPATGVYTMPYSGLVPPITGGDSLARRLFARESETQASQNPGATLYAETALYAPDDAGWGNARNNFSSRLLTPLPVMTGTNQPLSFAGDSYRTSALEYWAWATPGVAVGHADLHELNTTVIDRWDPYAIGDTSTPLLPQSQWVSSSHQVWTRFTAASAVTDNGDGSWTYTYAVLNANSHRAGAAWTLRLPAGATVSSTGFHAPAYHSGDRVRNAPWATAVSPDRISWQLDPSSETVTLPTVGQVTLEPNALRFATVYSFSVTLNVPPATGSARLALWRAPADATGDAKSSLAITGLIAPAYCTADTGGPAGVPEPDGVLDNNDFIAFINGFFNTDLLIADVGSAGGEPLPDSVLDNNDFIAFIDAFFNGCGT